MDLGRVGLFPKVLVIVFAVFWAALSTEEKNPPRAIGLFEDDFPDPGVLPSSSGVRGGVASWDSLLGGCAVVSDNVLL